MKADGKFDAEGMMGSDTMLVADREVYVHVIGSTIDITGRNADLKIFKFLPERRP